MRALLLSASCLASAGGLVVGCGVETGAPATGQATSAIVGGTPDDASNDDVVLLVTDLGGGQGRACTGTLVARNVAVTARHCVSHLGPGPLDVGDDYPASAMSVWIGATPRGDAAAHVTRIVHDDATTLADHDLAVVVLDRRVGSQISAMRTASPAVVGEVVKVVGYGVTELDTTLPTSLHARYRRDALSVLQVGPGRYFTPTAYDLGAHELSLGESICEGDSGGPVKDAATGALLGVASRGGNEGGAGAFPYTGCIGERTVNTFTRVDAFAPLIEAALASVGELPWLEGQARPAEGSGAPPVAAPAAASGGCSMLPAPADAPPACLSLCAVAAVPALARASRRRAARRARDARVP